MHEPEAKPRSGSLIRQPPVKSKTRVLPRRSKSLDHGYMKFKRVQNENSNHNDVDHPDPSVGMLESFEPEIMQAHDEENTDPSGGMLESFEPDIMTPESDEGDPWYGFEDSDQDSSSSSGDEVFEASILTLQR